VPAALVRHSHVLSPGRSGRRTRGGTAPRGRR
jgi:hypothetical protein